jgi:hypothetical protein
VKARSYTTLLYRHWTEWQTKRRSHLMVVDVAGGPVKDLTPGDRDVPPFSLGGPDDYAISADSKEVCYSMNADPVPATSTNSDLFVVPIIGGDPPRSPVNPGADASPQYSPDGKWLAYRSQARAGYESDRWRLAVLERATGRVNMLTDSLDRWVQSFTWSPDSNALFFTVEDRGSADHRDDSHRRRRYARGGQRRQHLRRHEADRRRQDHDLLGPKRIGAHRALSRQFGGGAPVALTHLNDALLAQSALTAAGGFLGGWQPTRRASRVSW